MGNSRTVDQTDIEKKPRSWILFQDLFVNSDETDSFLEKVTLPKLAVKL